jgi:hypothetical protein
MSDKYLAWLEGVGRQMEAARRMEDMLRQRVLYVPANPWAAMGQMKTIKPTAPAKPMKPPVAVPLSELMSELEEAGTERIKLFV